MGSRSLQGRNGNKTRARPRSPAATVRPSVHPPARPTHRHVPLPVRVRELPPAPGPGPAQGAGPGASCARIRAARRPSAGKARDTAAPQHELRLPAALAREPRLPRLRKDPSRFPSLGSGSVRTRSATMILRQILRLSSLFHSTVSIHVRRNIGLSAIVFNKTKELDPVQKLFLDKIREYNAKSKQAGGPVDAGPDFQKDMNESLARLQRAYGEGDLTKFPEFKFEEPKFEETPK